MENEFVILKGGELETKISFINGWMQIKLGSKYVSICPESVKELSKFIAYNMED